MSSLKTTGAGLTGRASWTAGGTTANVTVTGSSVGVLVSTAASQSMLVGGEHTTQLDVFKSVVQLVKRGY